MNQIFRCTITLVVLMATITSAQELPKMPSITAGQVDISQSLNELVVRQTSESGIINWDSFNVSQGAGVIFEQPSAKSITLNNILSAAPSLIDGQVTAPGRVFFSSPSGIVFGENARVNVNALLATNHSIERAGENEVDLKNPGLGKVVNLGTINAKSAYLIGRDVLNAGQITSSNGSIGLVAASDVRVSFDEAGLLTATIVADDVLGTITNTGTLDAGELGRVDLKASASEEIVASTIKNDATSASALISENGVLKLVNNSGEIKGKSVSLTAEPNGGVSVSGILSADNTSDAGGLVTITGKEVTLAAGALITAKGYSGGGTVLIGGDWQGAGNLFQSTYTNVESQVIVDTSATTSGDGGTIVAWSDIKNPTSITTVAGSLIAKGGSISGNGGQIETSGAHVDLFAGYLFDTTAQSGDTGKWLLDPYNYTIGAAQATNIVSALRSNNVEISTSSNVAAYGSSGNVGDAGNITLNSALTSYYPNRLTLTAAGSVDINAAVDLAGGLTVTAPSGINIGANITTGDTQIYNDTVSLNANLTLATGGFIGTFQTTNTNSHSIRLLGGSASVILTGAAGGDGGPDQNPGGLGGPGGKLEGSLNFSSDTIELLVAVGSSGSDGSGGNKAAGGAGGTNALGVGNGGSGGRSGGIGSSGSGGGGGAASVIKIGSNLEYIFAGGGGGGSGGVNGANGFPGRDISAYVGSGVYTGTNGGSTADGSDGNGGGGGGGGLEGGAGGTTITPFGEVYYNGGNLGKSGSTSISGGVSFTDTSNTTAGARSIGSASVTGKFGNASESAISFASGIVGNGNNLTLNSFTSSTLEGSGIADLTAEASSGLNVNTTAATGKITLSTKTGNIVVAGNLSTTSTATDAIVVNAGKDTAAGTKTGGNVTISGSPTLSVGTGGRATIYTGGISESRRAHICRRCKWSISIQFS